MPITEYCESTLIIKDKSEDEFPVSGKGHPHYLESQPCWPYRLSTYIFLSFFLKIKIESDVKKDPRKESSVIN